MFKKTKLLATTTALVALLSVQAGAANIASMALKGAAVGYLVKQYANQLDSFINTITLRHGLPHNLETKVVPILSVGDKGYIGGAQVAGAKVLVEQTKAVFQYEQSFDSGRYRIKALVPSSSINPAQLQRVDKVGVTAVIDVSLSGGLTHKSYSDSIGSSQILRAAGVAAAISAVAEPIDKAINAITFNKSEATAVIPIAGFGEKAYIGGAQISGSANTLNTAKVVWQFDDIFANGRFRVKVLVPTDAINPLKMKRVEGVGLTALIDTTVADQKQSTSTRDRIKERTKSRVLIPKNKNDNRNRR